MKTLGRYLDVTTFKAFILALAGLTSLLSLLDFVDQLHHVGQGEYHLINAIIYVSLTAPSRLLQLAPVALLFATLFTLGEMANNSEIVAMRALGISEYRITGSLFKLAAIILALLFVFAEFIIPPAERLATDQRATEIPASASLARESGLWAESNHQYLHVARFEDTNDPREITVYSFTDDGSMQSLTRAATATIYPDGAWILRRVTETLFTGAEPHTAHFASLPWHAFLTRAELRLLVLPPSGMPPVELFQYVKRLHQHGQPTSPYEQELWARISVPIAMIAMIILSVSLILGRPHLRGSRRTLGVGALIGILFVIAQQLLNYLGLLLSLNPAFTALTPPLLVIAISLSFFARANVYT